MKLHWTFSSYDLQSLIGHLVAIETQGLQGNRTSKRGVGGVFFPLAWWLNDATEIKKRKAAKGRYGHGGVSKTWERDDSYNH